MDLFYFFFLLSMDTIPLLCKTLSMVSNGNIGIVQILNSGFLIFTIVNKTFTNCIKLNITKALLGTNKYKILSTYWFFLSKNISQ